MTEKKVGRPKIEIDFGQLESLCELHCTRDEICDFFRIDEDTLNARLKEHGYDNFSAFYKKHLGGGKISLRRLQWQAAENGNVPMLIWLGKQMLAQSDKLQSDNNHAIKEIPKMQLEVLDTSNLNVLENYIKRIRPEEEAEEKAEEK